MRITYKVVHLGSVISCALCNFPLKGHVKVTRPRTRVPLWGFCYIMERNTRHLFKVTVKHKLEHLCHFWLDSALINSTYTFLITLKYQEENNESKMNLKKAILFILFPDWDQTHFFSVNQQQTYMIRWVSFLKSHLIGWINDVHNPDSNMRAHTSPKVYLPLYHHIACTCIDSDTLTMYTHIECRQKYPFSDKDRMYIVCCTVIE